MVPFVDMCNHDSHSRALLAYYEEEGYVEVVADKDYNQGFQVHWSVTSVVERREMSSPAARAKGTPRALRTFARVVSASTLKELQAMAKDAKRRQCGLAERALKDGKEARALKILLDTVDQCQSSHRSALYLINLFKACVYLQLRFLPSFITQYCPGFSHKSCPINGNVVRRCKGHKTLHKSKQNSRGW